MEDVFVSSYGPGSLVRSLCANLRRAGFELGDSWSLVYGGGTRVHVVVVWSGFAESQECLDELVVILRSRRPVVAAFCGVTPDDLRDVERGAFAAAFAVHKGQGRVREVRVWADACRELSTITRRFFASQCCDNSDGDRLKLEVLNETARLVHDLLIQEIQEIRSELSDFTKPKASIFVKLAQNLFGLLNPRRQNLRRVEEDPIVLHEVDISDIAEPSGGARFTEDARPVEDVQPAEDAQPDDDVRPVVPVQASANVRPVVALQAAWYRRLAVAVRATEDVQQAQTGRAVMTVRATKVVQPVEASVNVRPAEEVQRAVDVRPVGAGQAAMDVRSAVQPATVVLPAVDIRPAVPPAVRPAVSLQAFVNVRPAMALPPDVNIRPHVSAQRDEDVRPAKKPRLGEAMRPAVDLRLAEDARVAYEWDIEHLKLLSGEIANRIFNIMYPTSHSYPKKKTVEKFQKICNSRSTNPRDVKWNSVIQTVASKLSITGMDFTSKADRCIDSRNDAAHFWGVKDWKKTYSDAVRWIKQNPRVEKEIPDECFFISNYEGIFQEFEAPYHQSSFTLGVPQSSAFGGFQSPFAFGGLQSSSALGGFQSSPALGGCKTSSALGGFQSSFGNPVDQVCTPKNGSHGSEGCAVQ